MPKTIERRRMSAAEFQAALRAQGVPREHVAFRCPMCETVQSMTSLIRAGAGRTPEEVERYIGFSCIGRWTGAGSPRPENKGKGCNWTLGELLQLHRLEVVMDDGTVHPTFEPATPEEAQALMAEHTVQA